MTKIILFNGPPRSGKDTATSIAKDYLGDLATTYRFAGPLKDAVHGLYGIGGVLQEHFDLTKDIPHEMFFGMSPREAYIHFSEKIVKPSLGTDFFAKVAVNTIKTLAMRKDLVVVSDCGFTTEIQALADAFGADNIAIVYLKRQGTSFANDSRSYVHTAMCKKYTIENNGSLGDFSEKIKAMVDDFLGRNS